MYDFLIEVLKVAVTPLAVVGAVVYIAQEYFKHTLTRDLEQNKHKFAVELERFKREFDAAQHERQVKFSHLHQRRAEVIAEIYNRLAHARKAMSEMTSPLQPGGADKERQRKEAADAFNALQEYFLRHRLFLSAASAEKTAEIIQLMKGAYIDFDVSQGHHSGGKVDHRMWVQAWKQISEETPKVLSALEDSFRKMLGAD